MNLNLALPHLSLLAVLCSPVLSCPVFAATEFEDDVPLELVKIFLGNPALGEVGLYVDIPDEFPDFPIPDGFTVLGSIDQGYSLRVVLQTAQSPDMAKASIVDAFARNGWQEIQAFPGIGGQQTGFVSSAPPLLAMQLCHDDLGMLSGTVYAGDSGSLVNLSRNNNNPRAFTQPSCEEMNSQQRGFFRPGLSGIAEHMPRLELPESQDNRINFGNSGGGSSSHWEVSSSVDTDMGIEALYEHFADQVVEQGWTPDIETTGDLMATGGWTKTIEDDVELLGFLTIYESADDHYDMYFRLVRGNGNNAPVAIRNVTLP